MSPTKESFESRWARVLALIVPAVCHKLNNAISVVSGLSEIALRQPESERRAEQLEMVFEQATDASRLVSRLGSFAYLSRIETESVDAGRALLDAAGLLRSVFQVSATKFELRDPAETHPVVVDPRRLMQVLMLLACGPLLPPEGVEFDHEQRLNRLRLSIGARGQDTVIRISHPTDQRNTAVDTATIIAPIVQQFGGTLRTRTLASGTAHRLVLCGIKN